MTVEEGSPDAGESPCGEVMVLGIVKGLVASAGKVSEAFESFGPDAVAASISGEGLQAMVEHLDSGGETAGMDNVEEEYYVAALERFGEVRKPPPGFVKAWQLAEGADVPLYPVDFNDEEFTDLYCSYVSGLEWLRQPARQRAIVKKNFTSRTAEEFALEWDELVNGTKGMRGLERAREKKIGGEVAGLSRKHGRVLLVVDYERSEAVGEMLASNGCRVKYPEF